ncbi:restriction endonuclease subunit S [Limnohabitans sp. T6-5]|uniref:restriction endonuclease subunit S n=1 Tax=Limnohabitans sp. T6-5 TaxID=1100724 RepID=UPI000D3AA632|nr:restriction endonuclease subunit S [Limnohabitans sp. T6-5]PUE06916.1 restriction endonuclease subunit S [Limnohabitans sp. T6-5]
MSDVNFLDKLLDGVAVVWMPLGQVGEFIRGNGMQKKDFVEDGFPAIHYGQIYTRYGLAANTAFTCVEEGLAKRLRKAKNNDLLLATTSENDEDVVKPLAWLGTEVAISGDMMLFRHKQNVKYLAHYLQTNEFQEQKRKYITGAKVRRVSSGDLSKITVPIPCPDNPKKSLEIQAEIVRILDAFTELTTELTVRKKQYKHYRDQLLSFEDGEVEWKTLPEMALDFGRGRSKHRPRNDAKLYGGDIPFIQTGDIRSASHIITRYSQTYSEFGLKQSKLWPKGTLCITIAANIAETSILGFHACFPDRVIGFVADPHKTSADYVEYILQSVKNKLEEKGKEKSSAQSNINLATFEELRLPFPSLTEQTRIVAILEEFDALTNSITEGLPREIELRQKQYAHYRDLLLSFPKPQEVMA